jgi:hypothetical protein
VADSIGTAYESIDGAYRSLIAECDLNAFDARRRTARWSKAYYLIGFPAAILAAVAAATGLASETGRIPAGIISLVSAGLSAAVTFLNSEERRKHNDAVAAGWQSLAERARIALIARVKNGSPGNSGEALAELLTLSATKELLLREFLQEMERLCRYPLIIRINNSLRRILRRWRRRQIYARMACSAVLHR